MPKAPRLLVACICLSSSLWAAGCAICANSHDCDYPAYGGVIEREERVHGRVGSLYGNQPVFVPGSDATGANPSPAGSPANELEIPTPTDPVDPDGQPDPIQEGLDQTTPSPSDRPDVLPQPPNLDDLDDQFDAPPIPDDEIL